MIHAMSKTDGFHHSLEVLEIIRVSTCPISINNNNNGAANKNGPMVQEYD